MNWIPYVYFLRNRTTGLRYVGVRYAKGCHPSDLWVTYFSSSSLVKKLLDEFGKDDFQVKVWKTFDTPEAAILEEAKFFSFIKKRDNYLNMTYSSGIQDLRIASKAGKIGGAIVKARRIGIFAIPDVQKRLNASAGGKIGGSVCRDNKIGIHSQTREERLALSSKGGIAAIPNSGFKDSVKQADRGRRGGVKNKGSIWVTDGVIDWKYTIANQVDKSFDQFLYENPSYRRGRKTRV